MQTFYGKIKIKEKGQQFEVEAKASSPQAAKGIIEAQYGKDKIVWMKHMASS